MGRAIHLTDLSHKDIRTANSCMKYFNALFGVDYEFMEDFVEDFKQLKAENIKLKAQVHELIQTSNNNNKMFIEKIEELEKNFRLANHETLKDKLNEEEVELNLDA